MTGYARLVRCGKPAAFERLVVQDFGGYVHSAHGVSSRAAWLAGLGFLWFLSLDGSASADENRSSTNARERIQQGMSLYETRQYEAAIDLLKPFAKGDYRVIYRIYYAHEKLNRTKPFIDFALPLAQQGDADVQYFLAQAYESESRPNAEETVRWYRSAAQGGSQLAAQALGRIYYSGRIGFSVNDDDWSLSGWRNLRESERYFQLCVQLSQRHPDERCLTGLAILEAGKPQRSAEKVLRLLEDAEDYQSLWLIYEFGFITNKAEDRAAEYLRKLRQREDDTSFVDAVTRHHRGEAVGLQRLAVRLLPMGFLNNITDAKTAVTLMKRAADADNPEANYWMAHLHQKGRHVPLDDVLAYFYAIRGHALGQRNAKPLLDELERKMSQAEIAEAQRMARERAASGK
jgi:TPR repeat protein